MPREIHQEPLKPYRILPPQTKMMESRKHQYQDDYVGSPKISVDLSKTMDDDSKDFLEDLYKEPGHN